MADGRNLRPGRSSALRARARGGSCAAWINKCPTTCPGIRRCAGCVVVASGPGILLSSLSLSVSHLRLAVHRLFHANFFGLRAGDELRCLLLLNGSTFLAATLRGRSPRVRSARPHERYINYCSGRLTGAAQHGTMFGRFWGSARPKENGDASSIGSVDESQTRRHSLAGLLSSNEADCRVLHVVEDAMRGMIKDLRWLGKSKS